ncbi:LysR substrate binding domain-containing protein [Actinomycetospora succinea]|uniref:LysR substrate binding domain-containing protein n=1 Tax=Actinomycetospora succinea TaxID=663603 RepID=A0A4R6VAT1_9PSEU|nr:LysR substrate-binding domain-containing protein [Actinomycetospora succinea]TDQ58783.1 LysR substrate binding domain-containing protein [Actinomycetospora succinea]
MTAPDEQDDTFDPYADATAVAVAASTVPGEFLVPDLVETFTAEHPEAVVDTVVTDSEGVFTALRDGNAEVGFAGAEPDGDDLDAEVLTAEEIVLAVPRGHALDTAEPVTVAQLAATPLVEREEGSGTRRSFTDALATRGTPLISDQRWTIRDSNQGVIDAVAAGDGVGVVSSWALARHAHHGVREVRLEGDPIERCLYLVLRRDDDLGPAATSFVTLAREQAQV